MAESEDPLPPLDPKCLFSPSKTDTTALEKFRNMVNKKHSIDLRTYDELHAWSCSNLKEFWGKIWDFVQIIYSQSYMQVINESVSMDRIPEWFMGARLNFAENLLRFKDDAIAIVASGESGFERKVTYAELNEMVRQCANALKAAGVAVGDRVVAYIPNCVESVVGMLASASIGATWSSASPDFGTTVNSSSEQQGVLDRFLQIKPKVLLSVNAVVYNGKVYDHISKLQDVASELPTLLKVVVINFVPTHPTDISSWPESWIKYDDFISAAPNNPLKFEQLPFNHPLYILYSSGTTGLPKCIVHSTGGTLIQHMKEHILHCDITRKDVFFQYTTTGWMMWNWLVSALSVGCTIVLYDGSPFKPNEWVLWEMAQKYKFTKFGTSAKYIQSMQEMKMKPSSKYDLSELTEIYSTGSPLTPENYDYVYENIKSNIFLSSITGGTDIVSLFAGPCHLYPVHRGEIVCKCLGMALEAWDEEGKKVDGRSGDLVCTKPFPCMPIFFWNDPGYAKYKDAYFSKFPGVWYHGDYVWFNPNTNGVVMLGRSDGVLKPSGVRFGSAEIYNIVNKYVADKVKDCLCVGQRRPTDTDERVVLFLKMADGQKFNDELMNLIKSSIRKELSPRHVPSFILPIDDIPYTINGKKVEVAVKKIISGHLVVPSATLANPESLKLYENIQVLQADE